MGANKKMMGKTEMRRKTGATETSHTTGKRTIYSIFYLCNVI